jgi:hypothetical protein
MTKEPDTQTKPPKKKRKHTVGKIILLIIVLIIAAGAILYFRVPQKIGLIKSPADRLFTVTPDSEKADAVMEDLKEAGLNTQGVEVYVMPVSGTDDNVAMIVLDVSKGFDFSNYSSADPVKDFLTVLAQEQPEGINRAAVAYYDEEGKQLVAATLPTDAIVAYTEGKITDRQLMEKMNVGTEDVTGLIGEIQSQLK